MATLIIWCHLLITDIDRDEVSRIGIADSTTFRAPNNAAGKCWMDALELALRCSSLLLRTMSSTNTAAAANGAEGQVRFEF